MNQPLTIKPQESDYRHSFATKTDVRALVDCLDVFMGDVGDVFFFLTKRRPAVDVGGFLPGWR